MTDELPKLVVTRDGVPVADQAQGLRDFKEACRRRVGPPLPPSVIWERITDACIADIMALSDEEILKEAAEDGEDVHEIAERARERIRKAMEEAKRRAVPDETLDSSKPDNG